MRNYQEGGLAAVTAAEEETPMGPPEGLAEDIVERTTNPRAGVSMNISDLILQNKQRGIETLRATRENLAARRQEARAREEQDRWLAFAQAMLAPTRTGAFGESLGTAAGNLLEERQRSAAAEAAYDDQLNTLAMQEIAIENNMIDQMLKEATSQGASKAAHGAIQTMVHPDDRNLPVEDQRIIFGAMMRDPDDPRSELTMRALEDPDNPGQYFLAASKMDPARVNALVRATEIAERSVARSQEFIDEAYGRRGLLRDVRGAINLLENADTIIETSGIQGWKNRLANFIGVDMGDTTELTVLQRLMAQDFLNKLADLKGPASDRDLAEMQRLSAGMGQNTEANYQILMDMKEIAEGAMARGVREAYYAAQEATSPADRRFFMDNVGDLWADVQGVTWRPGAVPISSNEEYEDLAPGTYFYRAGDWGGVIRQKPEE